GSHLPARTKAPRRRPQLPDAGDGPVGGVFRRGTAFQSNCGELAPRVAAARCISLAPRIPARRENSVLSVRRGRGAGGAGDAGGRRPWLRGTRRTASRSADGAVALRSVFLSLENGS